MKVDGEQGSGVHVCMQLRVMFTPKANNTLMGQAACKCPIGVKQSDHRLGSTHRDPPQLHGPPQLFCCRSTSSTILRHIQSRIQYPSLCGAHGVAFSKSARSCPLTHSLSIHRLVLPTNTPSPHQHAMKTSTTRMRSAFSQLLRRPTTSTNTPATPTQPFQVRSAHRKAEKVPVIPSPIPFVPDVKTFLTVIGRGLSQHTAKFPTWEALFSLTSPQLKELGIEPPRTRKYLIHWREKYRLGYFGPGGDIVHVQDGKAKLAIEEKEVAPLEVQRRVVNIPVGKKIDEVAEEEKIRVDRYKVLGTAVAGPYALPAKGEKAAWVTATEGMWEEKRGRKVDGGERRRAEVRFKRRIAERKAEREAAGFT